jgi:hypothetical protein
MYIHYNRYEHILEIKYPENFKALVPLGSDVYTIIQCPLGTLYTIIQCPLGDVYTIIQCPLGGVCTNIQCHLGDVTSEWLVSDVYISI